MIVAHLDTEGGRDSIAHLISAGKVVSYDASTFEKAEQLYWALYYGKIKADVIVLDTVSTLLDQYVRDITLDPGQVDGVTKTWWNMRTKMRTNQDLWNIVNFGMGNLLSGLRNLPIPSIFNVHEVEREDPTADVSNVDRHLPSLSPKVLRMVMARSDLVLRIYKSPGPFVDQGRQYGPNTIILQIVNTAQAYTGIRVTPEIHARMPQYIPDPTLGKLAQAIGYLPKAMTVYGFPKTGKTVLSCTMPI